MCELCGRVEAERRAWIEDAAVDVCGECYDRLMKNEVAGISN